MSDIPFSIRPNGISANDVAETYLTIASASSTYEPIQPAKVNLSARKTSNTTITVYNQKTDIIGYTIDVESNTGSLNTSTGIFTAPRSGLYKVETQITFKDYEGERLFTMDNFIDYKALGGGWVVYKIAILSTSDKLLDAYTLQNSSIIYLNINDQIKVAGAARAGGTLAWTILAQVGSWIRATTLNIYSID